MELQNVVLVDGVRSPFARGGRGMLVATRLDETAALVLRTLMGATRRCRCGWSRTSGWATSRAWPS